VASSELEIGRSLPILTKEYSSEGRRAQHEKATAGYQATQSTPAHMRALGRRGRSRKSVIEFDGRPVKKASEKRRPAVTLEADATCRRRTALKGVGQKVGDRSIDRASIKP